MAVDTGPFPQTALDTNKSGRLTDTQQKWLRAQARGTRKSELSAALFCVALGIFLFIAIKPSAPVLERVGIPVGLLAVAVFLFLRAITGGDRLTRDLRRPRVESLEGPISRHTVTSDSEGSSSTSHYLDVAGKRFAVGRAAYQAAPDAGFVCIYFLPISRHVVNLERLPDRTLPAGTTVQTLAQQFKQTLRPGSEAKRDEIRAELAGTANAMKVGFSSEAAAPPPAGNRDQRPLAEAIQGAWSNGAITATFSENGTFSITMPLGNARSGHWSVDGNGKLVADLAGRNQATDAWIVGNQLTVSLGGSAITLQRVSG